MKITSDDIEWFKKAADTVSKGYYPNGQKAIDDKGNNDIKFKPKMWRLY